MQSNTFLRKKLQTVTDECFSRAIHRFNDLNLRYVFVGLTLTSFNTCKSPNHYDKNDYRKNVALQLNQLNHKTMTCFIKIVYVIRFFLV